MDYRHGREVDSLKYLFPLVVLVFGGMLLPADALADGIIGYLDLSYSNSHTETTDASGASTDTKLNSFNQQLNLTLTKTIYPNLRLLANGIFENDKINSETNGVETDSTTRILRPFVDLTLRTPLYTAGVNYTRRETKNSVADLPSTTDVNEAYSAILGWRPDGFPSFDMRYVHTNTFDKEHLVRDNADDFFSLQSQYDPVRGVGLRYRGTYDDSKEKLQELETKNLTNDVRIIYDGKFLRDRATVSASYEITTRSTEIITSGQGEVDFQIFPFSGLSSIDDTPLQGVLDPNPALIDGNLTAAAGINIGLPQVGGDTKPRNIGLDFVANTEVNELFLYVDRELPAEVAASFSWDVYISPDNLNWTLWSPLVKAQYDAFRNRFEIGFQNVQTRYIKVVVNPLSPAVLGATQFPNILVTEMEAYIRRAAEGVKGKIKSTTHNVGLDGRYRLLDDPLLYYEVSYFLIQQTGVISSKISTLSNGFSVSKRLSRVFSGNARIAREDSVDRLGNTHAYVYSAALNATPLKTLSHSLTFSGRNETNPQGKLDRNSIFLYNSADLYTGISLYASGGLGFSTLETGRKQDSTILNGGTNIVPNRYLSLNLNYASTVTDETGGGLPEASFTTRRTDVGVTCRPFPLLYLVASWGWVTDMDRKMTLQNYGVNWTPFVDGQLQFSFAYNENLQSDINGKVKNLLAAVRWNITQRSYLDVAYQVIDTSSVTETAKANIFSTTLRIYY
ncbi:MAG: hypothetical protein M0Z71_00570 [Nitrospiraceae bacterium]|nr:hypothetical protein [Nitrospiraceae bacterium]